MIKISKDINPQVVKKVNKVKNNHKKIIVKIIIQNNILKIEEISIKTIKIIKDKVFKEGIKTKEITGEITRIIIRIIKEIEIVLITLIIIRDHL